MSEQEPPPEVQNVFELTDVPLMPVPESALTVLDDQIEGLEAQIAALRGLNLHATASIAQQKLDKLLQEKRELLEG